MRQLVPTLALLFVAAAAALAQKPVDTASSLVVDGKTIALHYAYVVDVDNVEEAGLLLSGPQKYLVLVLSDHPLPPSSVANRFAPLSDFHSPAQIFQPLQKSPADAIYGVSLKLDPTKKTVLQSQFFYPGSASELRMSVQGTDIPDKISGLKRDGKYLSGTAFLPTTQSPGFEKGPKKYKYRVSFKAIVQSEPAVTQTLEGKAALDSAPVQTIKAYLEAAKKSDVPALRKLTAETHQTYLDKPEVLKFLQDGDASKLPEQIKRVIIRGNRAAVVTVNKEPNYSQVTLELVKEKGDWKWYWP